MKNIFFLPLSFFVFFLFGSNLFSQTISLAEAVSITVENNENLKRAKERYLSKQNQYYASWGNFLPQVGIDWSFNKINEDLTIDLSSIRLAMISLSAKNQTDIHYLKNPTLDPSLFPVIYNQYFNVLNSQIPQFKEIIKQNEFKSSFITGIQPLFLGGKLIFAKNTAKEEEDIAYQEYLFALNEAVSETISSYLACAFLKEVIKVRKEVLDGISKHKEEAEAAFDAGLIPQVEVLKAKAALAEAERNLQEDQNKYELALLSLKKNLGINLANSVQTKDSLYYRNISFDYDSLSSLIQSKNYYLKIIESKISQAKNKYWIDFSNFLPQVIAFGKYEFYPEYQSAIEPRWIVGIQIKQNIFNGFKDYLALQSDKNAIKEAKYASDYLKKNIELASRKTYLEFENARVKYLNILPSLELFAENLRANEKRFESGYGRSLDVIDARLSYEKAQTEALSALYDYYLAISYLYFLNAESVEFLKLWK